MRQCWKYLRLCRHKVISPCWSSYKALPTRPSVNGHDDRTLSSGARLCVRMPPTCLQVCIHGWSVDITGAAFFSLIKKSTLVWLITLFCADILFVTTSWKERVIVFTHLRRCCCFLSSCPFTLGLSCCLILESNMFTSVWTRNHKCITITAIILAMLISHRWSLCWLILYSFNL